jgi:hypothetical protein
VVPTLGRYGLAVGLFISGLVPLLIGVAADNWVFFLIGVLLVLPIAAPNFLLRRFFPHEDMVEAREKVAFAVVVVLMTCGFIVAAWFMATDWP